MLQSLQFNFCNPFIALIFWISCLYIKILIFCYLAHDLFLIYDPFLFIYNQLFFKA